MAKIHAINQSSYVPVEDCLAAAADLDSVVIIGFRNGEFWLSSSEGDLGHVLLSLELAKKKFLDIIDAK